MSDKLRIGRYENPFLSVVWRRPPPKGTHCEPFLLETEDRALARGWLYSRGGERTVVCVMHPRGDFSNHYVVPGLLEAGFAVFCVNSRWLGSDATLVHEFVLLDVAASLRAIRGRYERVVLCGNSGGGSLYTFYLSQALAPEGGRLADTAFGFPFDLNRFEMPKADAMVYLGAHPGEGHFLLHAIDPSVADEGDLLSRDPALDLYDPDNGFREPPESSHYSEAFLAEYRAAQRVRVERLDALARERIRRRAEARLRWKSGGTTADRRASIATDYLVVYRTDADPRCVDLSLDPSKRDYGSLWGRRPDLINYGAIGFGRVLAPEAWLSTWSGLSSRAEIGKTGPAMTLPALVVSYTADNCIFPSDAALIARSLGTKDLARAEVEGDHYGFPPESAEEAVRATAEWLRKTG